MKKGVSPVVAVVLLIAIAVVAAVGVWQWVNVYLSKPDVDNPATQPQLVVENCFINGTGSGVVLATVRNIGSSKAKERADVYDTNSNLYVGYIVINSTGGLLSQSNISIKVLRFHNTSQITSGSYKILDSDYPTYQFSCA